MNNKYLRLTYFITAKTQGTKIYASSDINNEYYSLIEENSNSTLFLFKPSEKSINNRKMDTYAAYSSKNLGYDLKFLAVSNNQELSDALYHKKRDSKEVVNYLIFDKDEVDKNCVDLLQFDNKFRRIQYDDSKEVKDFEQIPLDLKKINNNKYNVENHLDFISKNTIVSIYDAVIRGKNIAVKFDDEDYPRFVDSLFTALKLLPARMTNDISFISRVADEIDSILKNVSNDGTFILGIPYNNNSVDIDLDDYIVVDLDEKIETKNEFLDYISSSDSTEIVNYANFVENNIDEYNYLNSFDEILDFYHDYLSIRRLIDYKIDLSYIEDDIRMVNDSKIDEYEFDLPKYKKLLIHSLISKDSSNWLLKYLDFLFEDGRDVVANLDYLIKLYSKARNNDLKQLLKRSLLKNINLIKNYEPISFEIVYDLNEMDCLELQGFIIENEKLFKQINSGEELKFFIDCFRLTKESDYSAKLEVIKNLKLSEGYNYEYLSIVLESALEDGRLLENDKDNSLAELLYRYYLANNIGGKRLLGKVIKRKAPQSFIEACKPIFDDIIKNITDEKDKAFIDAGYNHFSTTDDYVNFYYFSRRKNQFLKDYFSSKVINKRNYVESDELVSIDLLNDIKIDIEDGNDYLIDFKNMIEQIFDKKKKSSAISEFEEIKKAVVPRNYKFATHKKPLIPLAQLIVIAVIVALFTLASFAITQYTSLVPYGQLRFKIYVPIAIALMFIVYSVNLRRYYNGQYRLVKIRLNFYFILFALVLFGITFVLSIG